MGAPDIPPPPPPEPQVIPYEAVKQVRNMDMLRRRKLRGATLIAGANSSRPPAQTLGSASLVGGSSGGTAPASGSYT